MWILKSRKFKRNRTVCENFGSIPHWEKKCSRNICNHQMSRFKAKSRKNFHVPFANDWLNPCFSAEFYKIQKNIFEKVSPRPSFLKHTQRSRIPKLGLFWGPQKSEKFNFPNPTNKSVNHKIKSFAINWPKISIQTLKFAQN